MSPASLSLPTSLRIDTAEALYGALNASKEAAPTFLDANAVHSFGTAGIQLLISAKKTARVSNRPLQLCEVPEPFREAWSILGLAHELSALTETQENPEEA